MVDLQSARHIHLIGVGGCSMSGLARILKAHGHEVTGSDRERTQFTESLDEAALWFDNVPLSQSDRLRIGRQNAIDLLKLDL